MNQPLISIIIPAYNHGEELTPCLNSVLKQSYKNFEVIVVNDGSTDGTEKILEIFPSIFGSDKMKIINQKNQGAPIARNRGFKESKGLFIIFLDADIELREDALQKMMDALEKHPEASYAYCNFKFGAKEFKLFPFDREKIRKMNYIHTSSLIRRENFPQGGFDPSLKKFQDWDLWLTMLKEGHIGIWIPETLYSAKPRKKEGMSKWLPCFMYKINWAKFGIRIKAIEEYEKWKDIVLRKHELL